MLSSSGINQSRRTPDVIKAVPGTRRCTDLLGVEVGKEQHVKCVYFLCHTSIFSSPDKCIQGNINNFKELKECSEMLL